jgi:hypothetical protein
MTQYRIRMVKLSKKVRYESYAYILLIVSNSTFTIISSVTCRFLFFLIRGTHVARVLFHCLKAPYSLLVMCPFIAVGKRNLV